MKRFGLIIMGVALVLGMAQCKKNVATVSEGIGNQSFDGSIIRLKVNDGGKLAVFPATGAVYYTEGDVIHVASGGAYKGTLTFHDGYFTDFDGTAPDDGATMYFYYLGGKTPTEAIGDGTLTVNISDQTTGYPVISYGASNETYSASNANYTATLKNVGALVKFDVTSESVTVPTLIKGMNNKVQFTLSNNAIGYTKVDDGYIKLPAGSGERWAVLLPQSAVGYAMYSIGVAIVGTGISETVAHGAIPAIKENDYLSSGIGVTATNLSDDSDGNDYYFTVSDEGTMVYFGRGDLENHDGTYSFAETQWTDHSSGTLGYFSTTQARSAVTGLNTANYGDISSWRMLTYDEWEYLFNTRTTVDGTAGKGHNWQWIKLNDVTQAGNNNANMNGAIVYPDGYSGTFYTSGQSIASSVIPMGCVFLPAAGYLRGSVSSVGSLSVYRSSTNSNRVELTSSGVVLSNNDDGLSGYSVRVVVDVE